MGKNFSCNNTGKRKKSDFYETPYSMTQQLLEVEKFDYESVLEPCSGNGAIVKVLKENSSFKTIYNYDLEKDGIDFLHETNMFDCIITNPPFSLAIEFVKKAKIIVKHKIAMLLPLSYLHGEQRYKEVYQDRDFPLKCIHVFTRYPLLGDDLRLDGKYRTGMMVYAWFIWEKNYIGEPVIKWISNQNYILGKKDD